MLGPHSHIAKMSIQFNACVSLSSFTYLTLPVGPCRSEFAKRGLENNNNKEALVTEGPPTKMSTAKSSESVIWQREEDSR